MGIVSIPRRLGIAFVLSLLCGTASVLAIEQDQPFLMESWTLAPGSVFEILAVSDSSDRQTAWSLTKADGSFVQADRGPLFRKRFAETGDFLLRGEVTAADRTPVTQRTFAIHIVPGTPPLTTNAGDNMFVVTDPPFDAGGIVVVGVNLQTILVQANPGTMQPGVDVNSNMDTNGDGDATNDNDSRGTFFAADGSALRLWFTDGMTERTLTVRRNGAAGPVTQTIRLYVGSAPASVETPEQQPIPSPSGLESVRIEDRGNGTYAFSIDPAALSTEGRAILLYWDFGDGHQSMLDRPVHTYVQNGQYTVNLQARDLQTTQEALRITGMLPVNTVEPPQQSSSAQDGSALSSEASSSAASSSRFSLRSIATIGGGLLLAILVGFAAVTIVGKIVQRRLDREPPPPPSGKPVKKSPPPAGPLSLDQPPPMSVIDVSPAPHTEDAQETPDEETATPNDTAEEEPSKLSELAFKEEEAPSWLRQGHEEAEKRGHTVATALPDQEKSTEELPASQEPDGKESRPLPPWLEPIAPAPTEIPAPLPPAAASAPAQKPIPPPPPLPEPVTAPAQSAPPIEPEPQPEPSPVPPPPPSASEPTPAAAPSAPLPAPAQPATALAPTPRMEEKNELSEAERERRRKKRARYRANKKSREESAEQSDAPQEPPPALEPKPAPPASAPSPAKSIPVKKQEPPPPPAQESAPQKKASSSAKSTENKEETDEPIAIIRADNISQDQKGKKKS
ncbi:MAG: PKD domain-containing protein, partial [Candidatus Peregrinibacteria bacterium]